MHLVIHAATNILDIVCLVAQQTVNIWTLLRMEVLCILPWDYHGELWDSGAIVKPGMQRMPIG